MKWPDCNAGLSNSSFRLCSACGAEFTNNRIAFSKTETPTDFFRTDLRIVW